MKEGILLINLGTPEQPTLRATRSFLKAFLTDKRVIDLPALLRYVLVYGFILPSRPQKTVKAYQAIWTDQGSPLAVNSQELTDKVQQALPNTRVALGMRYGEPSIKRALNELADCEQLTILPLYPQYTSAATGSALEAALALLAKQIKIPSLKIITDFYQHPAYIKAQAACIKEQLPPTNHLIFSYHGIPQRQLGCQQDCTEREPDCYRSQCYRSSFLLGQALGLEPSQYTTAFQSRLGKTPWITPYTDHILKELAHKGIKDIAITCPSFVCDCLETLEEIAIQAKEQWHSLGGGDFTYIACMNSHPLWVQAVLEIYS